MRRNLFFTTFLAIVLITYCTEKILKCDKDEEYDEDVDISGCDKPPCKLVKGSSLNVTFKFKPEKDCKKVKNAVSAKIMSADVPFPGVDRQDSCDNIFKADDLEPGCPVEADKKYIYTSVIEVLKIYPTITTTVKWGLACDDGESVACFKVKAQIVSK